MNPAERPVLDPPKSYDEAMELRLKLIADVDRIQSELSRRTDKEWRQSALAELRQRQALLRQLKDWLRKNDLAKQSEWTLLARAHALLQSLEPVAPGHVQEIESLLDAIELVVPGQYLDPKAKGEPG